MQGEEWEQREVSKAPLFPVESHEGGILKRRGREAALHQAPRSHYDSSYDSFQVSFSHEQTHPDAHKHTLALSSESER